MAPGFICLFDQLFAFFVYLFVLLLVGVVFTVDFGGVWRDICLFVLGVEFNIALFDDFEDFLNVLNRSIVDYFCLFANPFVFGWTLDLSDLGFNHKCQYLVLVIQICVQLLLT